MNSNAVSLRTILRNARFVDCDDISVAQISADSRRVLPGDVFIAVRGTRSDGHDFVNTAITNGAKAIVTQQQVATNSIPQCVVPCAAEAFAMICMALQDFAADSITTAGVTGTNGKTTTTFMLRSILQHAGMPTGLVGTILNSDGHETRPASMTTPAADEIAAHFAVLRRKRTSHCVIEISSHALTQCRCAAVPLSAALITNITQDHFDYHQTPEAYRFAKGKIAELLHPDAPLLVNIDDPGCRQLMLEQSEAVRTITFGIENEQAELRAQVLTQTHRSQRIRLRLAQGSAEVRLRLIGRHNVSNSLAAAGLAEQLGVRLRDIANGLEALQAVPGRLERVNEGQPFQVLVDYAHTPDALAHSIHTIREFVPGRLICVFGAGGDRDRSKRPLMGAAAATADLTIVTSDNPRSEAVDAIIKHVVDGIPKGAAYLTEPDRRCAIANAFAAAEPGDVVLVAGKGHEGYQEIGTKRLPFDDREVSRQLLREHQATGAVKEVSPSFSLLKSG